MECISIESDGSITVRFSLAERREIENHTMLTLWRYLRTGD